MSIPFLFSAGTFNGFHYIDGGTFENAPLPPFFGKPAEEILIIQTCFKNNNNIEINNLKEYIIKIFFNCMKNFTLVYDSRKYNILTVPHMDSGSATSLDFKMDLDTKWKLFFHGFNLARHSDLFQNE
jgi:predicted acylesterase/phospholipase RssA